MHTFYATFINIWSIFLVLEYEGKNLLLHNVRKTDSGQIMCIANNGFPPIVSRQFQLVVKCKIVGSFALWYRIIAQPFRQTLGGALHRRTKERTQQLFHTNLLHY